MLDPGIREALFLYLDYNYGKHRTFEEVPIHPEPIFMQLPIEVLSDLKLKATMTLIHGFLHRLKITTFISTVII